MNRGRNDTNSRRYEWETMQKWLRNKLFEITVKLRLKKLFRDKLWKVLNGRQKSKIVL